MRQQRKASVGDSVLFLGTCASVPKSRAGVLGEVMRVERIRAWKGVHEGTQNVLIYHVLSESGRMYKARSAQFEVVKGAVD